MANVQEYAFEDHPIHTENPECPGPGCIFCVRDRSVATGIPFVMPPAPEGTCIYCHDTVDHSLFPIPAMFCCGHITPLPCVRAWVLDPDFEPFCPFCLFRLVHPGCGHKIRHRPAHGHWSLQPIQKGEEEELCWSCTVASLPEDADRKKIREAYEASRAETLRLSRSVHQQIADNSKLWMPDGKDVVEKANVWVESQGKTVALYKEFIAKPLYNQDAYNELINGGRQQTKW